MVRRTGTRHRAATSARRPQGNTRFRLSDIVNLRLKRRFQRRLLRWYAEHGRDLPWRKTKDPYRILVSEVMLQQTQVDRVVPKYHEFLDRYPTFQELAAAEPREVRAHWYPRAHV